MKHKPYGPYEKYIKRAKYCASTRAEQIQFFNKGYIREGEEGTGFRVYEGLPVTIKYQGIPVYVSSAGKLEVNIAN